MGDLPARHFWWGEGGNLAWGERKNPRVSFEKSIDAVLIGADGTWSRECAVKDISATGAKLVLKTTMAGLNITEFFLVLSPAGKPYRRCQLVRVDGEMIGVRFIASGKSGPALRD